MSEVKNHQRRRIAVDRQLSLLKMLALSTSLSWPVNQAVARHLLMWTLYAPLWSASLVITPALYVALLPDAIVTRWIRILPLSWSIWLFVGMVSASTTISRIRLIFEWCIAVTLGSILAQLRDLELANLTCVYPCFEPGLASNIRKSAGSQRHLFIQSNFCFRRRKRPIRLCALLCTSVIDATHLSII